MARWGIWCKRPDGTEGWSGAGRAEVWPTKEKAEAALDAERDRVARAVAAGGPPPDKGWTYEVRNMSPVREGDEDEDESPAPPARKPASSSRSTPETAEGLLAVARERLAEVEAMLANKQQLEAEAALLRKMLALKEG